MSTGLVDNPTPAWLALPFKLNFSVLGTKTAQFGLRAQLRKAAEGEDSRRSTGSSAGDPRVGRTASGGVLSWEGGRSDSSNSRTPGIGQAPRTAFSLAPCLERENI